MTAWLVYCFVTLVGTAPSVQWDAPEGCGNEEAMMKSVRAFMRADLPADAADGVTVVVQIEEKAGAYAAHVRVNTPLGESRREIATDSCEQAVAGAAIVVAVALDPLIVAERLETSSPEPQPQSGPATPTPPAPEPDPPPAPKEVAAPAPASAPPTSPEAPRVRGTLGASGVFDTGSLARVTGGAGLMVGLERGRLGLRLFGTYLAPVAREVPGSAAGAVEVQLGTAAVHICFMPSIGRLEFPSCALFEAGAVRGRGRDVPNPSAGHEPYVAAGVSAGLRWRFVPRFALALGASGVAVFLRPRFLVDDAVAYTAPPAALRVTLGPQLRF